MDEFQGRITGPLVVGGSTIPGEYLLPGLIGRFKAKYPEILVSLLIGSSRQVNEWVEDGRVELGVVGARPGARALEVRDLVADELVLIVPAGHPWAGRRTVSLGELRDEPLILRERGSGSRDALERALGEAGLDLGAFRIAGEIASTQAVKQAVRAGVGVSLISRRAVADECRAQLLSCMPLEDLRVARPFSLVTHRDRTRSPVAQAFVAFIESEFPAAAS
jgi:DNA-binding transcriptional LysR family regulator